MALVDFEQQKVLAMLEKDLLDSMINDSFVSVHIQSNEFELSHCIIPDDVIIEDDIMILYGNLQLTIKVGDRADFDITYSEIENGYHIHYSNIDYYIDFN